MKQIIRSFIRRLGFDVVPYDRFPAIVSQEFRAEYARFRPYSMVEWINLYNAWNAALYVSDAGIPGAIVECGVYKGGCVALMARALMLRGDTSRDIYLYDTFEGMAQPSEQDRRVNGNRPANDWYVHHQKTGKGWCHGTWDEVKNTMLLTGYPENKIHMVKGRVEDTIPATVPDAVSLLRLDTDWYESTRHEMTHLYPRLAKGGVLVIDDYGTWTGARQAVDEYLTETKTPLYFFFDRTAANATAIKTGH